MKQIFSTAALLTLTACSTGQIVTDVKVDSYQEEYDREVVTSPVMSDVEEVTLAEAPKEPEVTEAINTEPEPEQVAAVEPEPVVAEQVATKEAQDSELNAKFVGYTIQVAAFDSQKRFNNYVETIPTIKPVWKHTKNVNGKRMYAVLVGQYDTFLLAQKGAAEVSAQMGISAPYIRNVKRIINSDSPDIVQIK
ncbi:SPOR domain-containing protein [Vibrio ulleungensis]|uniref:SPOR domain-containing protein n=1 Tax=Vibrio ulleungensis TaxID=2807619 RepID=A0ABS2HGA1_9VIBR|nr:SPOR domain-containing protein [Vibrio ulleungensis]MBM7035691.1 SPOR domain-containing protein [Vibrio ulleungensis]